MGMSQRRAMDLVVSKYRGTCGISPGVIQRYVSIVYSNFGTDRQPGSASTNGGKSTMEWT